RDVGADALNRSRSGAMQDRSAAKNGAAGNLRLDRCPADAELLAHRRAAAATHQPADRLKAVAAERSAAGAAAVRPADCLAAAERPDPGTAATTDRHAPAAGRLADRRAAAECRSDGVAAAKRPADCLAATTADGPAAAIPGL